jgi:hypothetical protein
MPFTYLSGQPVLKGDRIRYHGEPGEVEFIAEVGDPDTSDLVEQSGGGCMIIAAGFGRVFVHDPDNDEDLELVSRAMK